MLQDQSSLLHKCFKARYFPRSNFLSVGDVPNSSYVWKSIIAAQPILKKGCCWRVGDGSSIRVTCDKWITNYPTNRVVHLPVAVDSEWRVSDLIDRDLQWWNRGYIERNFHREDAAAIIRIPLSRRQIADSIFWLHNKNGVYSVRSGYHVARQIMEEANQGESSLVGTPNSMWAKLWKLNVPKKIKVFGWSVCHNILPTRENLVHRKVVENVSCELCQCASESVLHVL